RGLPVRRGGLARGGGKKRHLGACTDWPDDDAGWLAVIAQLCFPPRLQQAGRLESASDANTSGLIGERPNRATSSIARPRSIGTIILPPPTPYLRERKLTFSGLWHHPITSSRGRPAVRLQDKRDFAALRPS